MLHVYKDVYPPVVGGIEMQIDMLRRAMPEVESTVLVGARGPRSKVVERAGGAEIRAAELGPRWLSVPVAPTFPRWVRRIDADLIHLHMPNPTGEVAALVGHRGRPIVASYHADVVRQARFNALYRPLLDAVLERASVVIAGSETLVETSPVLREHASKIEVIPHPIDTERYRREAVSIELVDAIRARYEGPIVLAVGRLVYYKGHEHLIDAARGLDASVVLVGSGPERKRLVAHARDVPNFHFAGELEEDELIAHLAASSCFVLPSTNRAESFGIAVAEAQALCLPAVVADTGAGTAEAIEDGETGILVPPADSAALREAIAAILADEERAERMGLAARERAVRRHALGERIRDVRELYRRVLELHGRPVDP